MEENKSYILHKKILIKGYIKLLTGLHIGGTNTELNIGGIDNFIVRNPVTSVPYIPGSSLKGKLRSLIEIKYGCATYTGKEFKASEDPKSKSSKLFGFASKDNSRSSRLIVRDCDMVMPKSKLSEKDFKELSEVYGIDKNLLVDFNNTDLLYAESKTETSIDRLTSKANPRTFERVPAGAIFKLDLVLNVVGEDDELELKDTFREAVELLKADYLGGNGSRGYGQVDIFYEMKELC